MAADSVYARGVRLVEATAMTGKAAESGHGGEARSRLFKAVEVTVRGQSADSGSFRSRRLSLVAAESGHGDVFRVLINWQVPAAELHFV